jgi:inorganic triphosphatase YgiF
MPHPARPDGHHAAVEIELQYLYRSTDPLLVPAELAGFALGGSMSFEIVDAYFDTADLALRRAGSSLRIRRQTNLPAPVLTWKGPATRRPDGAKEREEVEIPLDHVPADGRDVAAQLERFRLWDGVSAMTSVTPDVALEGIGELRNRRSAHLYVQGLHQLELTWDRLTYPVGKPEVRLEVEVKRRGAAGHLAAVDAELRSLYGKRLAPTPYGKSHELARRLYPEAFQPPAGA